MPTNTHKGSTVTVLRTATAGDPGLGTTDPTTMKLVQKSPPAPIISSIFSLNSLIPVPTQGVCYTAPTNEVV